jgi:hypothetical protein
MEWRGEGSDQFAKASNKHHKTRSMQMQDACRRRNIAKQNNFWSAGRCLVVVCKRVGVKPAVGSIQKTEKREKKQEDVQ